MQPTLRRLFPGYWLLVPVAVLLAILLAPPIAHAADDRESGRTGFDWEAFRARTSAQIKGVAADWTGSVAGDVSRSLEGTASLKFFETGNGRLKIAFYLGDTHAYYDGISIGGLVSCGTGPRTYPVWVRRRAGEQQPPGRLEVYFTESQAIASRRAGVTPVPRDDMYTAESGTVSLRLEEEYLEVRLDAVMSSGPLSPQASTPARIRLRAQARVERTLENDAEFSTSLCDAPPPFEMVKILPEDGRDNVLLERPEILLEFNQDIHPESLENPDLVLVRTMRLPADQQQTWRNDLPPHLQDMLRRNELPPHVQEMLQRGGAPFTAEQDWTPAPVAPVMEDDEPNAERVSGTIDLDGSRTVRFVPHEPLRGGVRYQVDVAHGPEGVRSTQFHELDEVPPNFFSTRVKPDQVRLHVYQTTRDAPLLLRKPAMARVFVDWAADLDIHPDWQVREYEVDLEITRDEQQGLVFPRRTHTVLRPDLYDDYDRRKAEDSINRFGWSPRARDIRQLVARVSPHDPWPGAGRRKAPEDTGERSVEFASSQVDELSVEAYVVRLWKWLGQPPDAGTIANVISAFRQDNEFARQLFPVVRVRGHYGGVFMPPEDLRRSSVGLAVQARILHDHVALQSDADIVVGYYPPNMVEGRGQGIAMNPDQRANVVLMPVRPGDQGIHPAILDMPLVTHEYGHVFGLHHNPRVDDVEREMHCGSLAVYAATSEGIEGFRIAADGNRGWSKSSTTGNAQDQSTLKDLMYPCVYDHRDWWWISDRDYKRLVKDLPGLLNAQRVQRYLRHHGRRPPDVSSSVLLDRPVAAPARGRRRMLVSGTIEGDRVRFMPTVDLPEAGPLPEPGGDLTVVVEAANGALLATRDAVVVRDEDGDAFAYFSAVVEVEGEPARIALKRGRQELGDVAARVPPGAPRITSHADGASLAHGDWLRWEPVDVEGARYSVRYRPDPEASPRVLAALVDATAVSIDLAVLPVGASPTLEVVAHSGMHEARTLLRVQVVQDTRPMLVFPVDDAAPVHDEGIGAWFNSTLEADSVGADAIRLFDAQGRAIPVDARLLPSGDGVHGVPREPLLAGERYTVHLGAGLRYEDGRVMENPVRWSFQAGGARVADAPDRPKRVK